MSKKVVVTDISDKASEKTGTLREEKLKEGK
jgi:hypothetical protein